MSQPIRRSARNWAWSSTPSATVTSCRLWPSRTPSSFSFRRLLAPASVGRFERQALPPSVTWPALGVGMVAGWVIARGIPPGSWRRSSLPGRAGARWRETWMPAWRGSAAARCDCRPRFGGGAPRLRERRRGGVGWVSAALATVLDAALVVTLAWQLWHARDSARAGGEVTMRAATRGQLAGSCSAVLMAASVTWVMPNRVARISAAAMTKTARRPSSSPRRPPAAAPRGLVPQATSR
jgi:hypothetical protein